MSQQNDLLNEDAIEEREYQINIADVAKELSTLVVLPTGMGKTIIAFMVMAEQLERHPEKKILFLAPTKPLVNQHARDISELLDVEEPEVFTGEVRPAKREELWDENRIIVSTPQVVRNDLMSQRIDLDDVSLTVFDEAHRAVGDYAYVYIGEVYREKDGLSLGLTASPGSERGDILSVCETLGFEHVEIRTKYDPDVVKYTNYIEKKWVDVKLPKEQREIVDKLKKIKEKEIKELQKFGFLENKNPDRISRKNLIKARKKIQGELHSSDQSSLYRAASLIASSIKIDHAVDQAETQGPDGLREFLDKLENEAGSRGGSKASKRLIESAEMKDVLVKLKKLSQDHPKISKVVEVVEEQMEKKEDSRIIVFTNYRNTATKVKDRLNELEGVRPARFIGQTDKKGDEGLKQDEQIETIDQFESGEFNVLVATSVGEEGLDIPATDLVVFYEPVPSEIRTIQRRGRTAREREGKVVILITKDTRDQAYYWSSKNKEKKMHKNLMRLRDDLESEISVGDPMDVEEEGYEVVEKKSKKDLKEKIERNKSKKEDEDQRSLMDFEEEKKSEKKEEKEVKTITVDTREQNSRVVQDLAREDIKIKTSQLSIGDYIISEDTAVERKEVSDFLESITDGRLFSQARSLSENYQQPIIILEGEGLYERRNISDNAIYGALSSLACDFRIPILNTQTAEETSSLLTNMVKRKEKKKKSTSVRKDKRSMSTYDNKKYILEGLPSISGTLAERLLDHFGSVRDVFTAEKEELEEVKGIGPSTAEKIISIISE
ncbi:MAG: DEAD/DEAH box helicase family protein [Candidatus Thermoplasmatota archaeon]|nr:DEAD/DEAH box helicase family protein [Candidatus Thermoplasmatota archaeon]